MDRGVYDERRPPPGQKPKEYVPWIKDMVDGPPLIRFAAYTTAAAYSGVRIGPYIYTCVCIFVCCFVVTRPCSWADHGVGTCVCSRMLVTRCDNRSDRLSGGALDKQGILVGNKAMKMW